MEEQVNNLNSYTFKYRHFLTLLNSVVTGAGRALFLELEARKDYGGRVVEVLEFTAVELATRAK